MSVLEIIYLVILVIETLTVAIVNIIKAVQNGWIEKLTETAKESIKEAEYKFNSGEGKDKTTYVLSKISAKCEELGIPYAKIESNIRELIDKVIADYNLISKK